MFDIKDPYHPMLIHTIIQLPDAEGTVRPIGMTPGLAEKDGWVYLWGGAGDRLQP